MKRGKPLSFDRDQALKRAMEFFWIHGYEASGITALIESMGIPRQSFYNTFGSKEEIFIESMDLYSADLHQSLRKAIDGANTPFEKIDRLFEMWEQMGSSGCFLGNCVAEFGSTNGRVSERMATKLQSIRGVFSDIFQEAMDRGDLPADRDAQVMASTLMTYSQGLALISKIVTDKDQRRGSIEIMKQSLKQ